MISWSEFRKSSEIIGSGGSGSVFKTYWQTSHRYVAYKKSDILVCRTWEAFRHELRMQIRAHGCENIIQILGISKSKP